MGVASGGTDLSTSEGGNEGCERWAEGLHRLNGASMSAEDDRRAFIVKRIPSKISCSLAIAVAISGKGF